jgi:hypothetical protein
VDPYQNYDPYQKYYASRPRDPEFPGQRLVLVIYLEHKINSSSFSSDYDLYSNYRNGSYGITNGPEQARHDLSVNLQPPPGAYPPMHRQHHAYTRGSSNLAPYYGDQQR